MLNYTEIYRRASSSISLNDIDARDAASLMQLQNPNLRKLPCLQCEIILLCAAKYIRLYFEEMLPLSSPEYYSN